MKKVMAFLLALCLCIGLCACSDNASIQAEESKSIDESPAEESKSIDESPVDYYQQLYDYIIREGYCEDGVYYVYTTDAANVDLMLIAEKDTLRYWYMADYSTGSTSFVLDYEVTFNKEEASSFEFHYLYVTKYYDGIAIEGENAQLTGTIDPSGDEYTIATENYIKCDADEIQKALIDRHKRGVRFIKDVMEKANIHCSFEELFG